jgi:hypothetical protein
MTTLSLYSAADQLAPLLDQIDPETGEMSEELGAALAQFEGKGEAVTAYILNLDANAEMIRAAAAKMIERAEKLEKRAAHYRDYLAFNMKRTGITQISARDGSFEARLLIERDASVHVFDEKQLPAAYMRTPEPKPVVPVPNKKAIAAALRAGKDVPGAKIIKNDRLELK